MTCSSVSRLAISRGPTRTCCWAAQPPTGSRNGKLATVELAVGAHRIPFSVLDDLPQANAHGVIPRITLRMKVFNYTYPDKFDVQINGHLLAAETRKTRAVFIMNNDTWIAYPLSPDLLQRGQNELLIDVRKQLSQLHRNSLAWR